MRYADIEKDFTNEVMSYMALGYVISSRTMSGSQGEIAKVDLTNGNEIVRILLDRKSYTMRRLCEGIELTVCRSTDERFVHADPLSFHNTLWTNNMEVVKNTMYWQMEKNFTNIDFFIPGEEGDQAAKRHEDRMYHKYVENRVIYNESAYRIGLKLLRKIPGHKNKKLSDIEKFWKIDDEKGKRYYVKVKGNTVAVA